MTNREWLNTLSDEEYAKEWLKIEKMLHGDCGFHIETIMQYLQSEHVTTADEDFAEIGFNGMGEDVDWQKEKYFPYEDGKGRTLYVNVKSGNEYDLSADNDMWTDELIDKVRIIADKKRKEMG